MREQHGNAQEWKHGPHQHTNKKTSPQLWRVWPDTQFSQPPSSARPLLSEKLQAAGSWGPSPLTLAPILDPVGGLSDLNGVQLARCCGNGVPGEGDY